MWLRAFCMYFCVYAYIGVIFTCWENCRYSWHYYSLMKQWSAVNGKVLYCLRCKAEGMTVKPLVLPMELGLTNILISVELAIFLWKSLMLQVLCIFWKTHKQCKNLGKFGKSCIVKSWQLGHTVFKTTVSAVISYQKLSKGWRRGNQCQICGQQNLMNEHKALQNNFAQCSLIQLKIFFNLYFRILCYFWLIVPRKQFAIFFVCLEANGSCWTIRYPCLPHLIRG